MCVPNMCCISRNNGFRAYLQSFGAVALQQFSASTAPAGSGSFRRAAVGLRGASRLVSPSTCPLPATSLELKSDPFRLPQLLFYCSRSFTEFGAASGSSSALVFQQSFLSPNHSALAAKAAFVNPRGLIWQLLWIPFAFVRQFLRWFTTNQCIGTTSFSVGVYCS